MAQVIEPVRPRPKLFIDSGAYSAETRGAKISVYQYASFIKRWWSYLDLVCNLDVIGDAPATWRNQELLESLGIRPFPTFHFGEDPSWLIKYVERYDYIALGGQVGQSPDALCKWLDDIWDRYLTNKDGLPVVRVHAFGVTSPEIMTRYPWHSVDSTSWLLAAATGKVVMCDWDAQGSPTLRSLSISDKAPDQGRDQHLEALRPVERDAWVNKLAERGFSHEALAKDYTVRFFSNALAYVTFAEMTPSYRPFFPGARSLFPEPKEFPDMLAYEPWKHLTMYLAGNPGASNITRGLMKKGYNRLLSYHYIAESMSHFNEAREVLDKWQPLPSAAAI